MKTLNFLKTSVLMVGLTIIVASCGKVELPAVIGTKIPPTVELDDTDVLGQILDVGLVGGNTKSQSRQMTTSFFGTGQILEGSTGYVKGDAQEINISFYTDLDHMVPTGKYTFSQAQSKENFSFDSGTVNFENESAELVTYVITLGEVDVLFDGKYYEFSFNCTLENGDLLSGVVKGRMSYLDVWQ